MSTPTGAPPRLRTVHAAFAFAVVVLVIQAVRRSFQPLRHVITIVPDDAFYYLSLARHYAQSGIWTFDGGVSRTSGFHPLHAYVCALIFRLWPSLEVMPLLLLHAWIGVVATAVGLWFLLRVVDRHLGDTATLGIVVVSTSSNFLVQSTSAMEWHWVVLFASLTIFAVTEGRTRLAVAAGMAGALSRSDFPLLTVAAVGAGLFVARRGGDRRLLRSSLWAFAGAVCGFCLLTAHNYSIAHEIVQSSARIKAFWGKSEGYQPRYGFEIAARAASPGSILIEMGNHTIKLVAALHAAALVVLFALLRFFPPARPARPAGDVRPFLLALAVLATTGFALLYGTTAAAIQTWYTANFVVPVSLLYALALAPARWRPAAPALFVPAALFAVVGLRDADKPGLPGDIHNMDAGLWLKEHGPAGRVGTWNAGIINYFEGGHVVNIDGLTNNDVVPYILADKLHCYLYENDIRHVMDWQDMLTATCSRARCPNYPALGGYTSGLFARSLEPEYVVATVQASGFDTSLRLYSVDMDLLAREGACRAPRGRAAPP